MQINPDLAKQMKAGHVTLQDIPSFDYVYIYLWPGTPLGKDVKLDDQRVRQAIRDAVDYKGMIDNTVGGSGRMQPSNVSTGFSETGRASSSRSRRWPFPITGGRSAPRISSSVRSSARSPRIGTIGTGWRGGRAAEAPRRAPTSMQHGWPTGLPRA